LIEFSELPRTAAGGKIRRVVLRDGEAANVQSGARPKFGVSGGGLSGTPGNRQCDSEINITFNDTAVQEAF